MVFPFGFCIGVAIAQVIFGINDPLHSYHFVIAIIAMVIAATIHISGALHANSGK